jgi:hypothetical protein
MAPNRIRRTSNTRRTGLSDDSMPAKIAARVVPGLCRTAVEAAFTEAVWRRELRVGRSHRTSRMT